MRDEEYQKEIKELREEAKALKALVNKLLYENTKIKGENELLRKENKELKEEVKKLKTFLFSNSQNSSKPPSSDKVRRTGSLRGKGEKKAGGQPGHNGDTLKMVENPEVVKEHKAEVCVCCGTDIRDMPVVGIKRRQVFDLVPKLLEVTEHQAEIKVCECCNQVNEGIFPEDVKAPVQYGSRAKALGIYFHNYQLIPFDRVSQVLQHLLGTKFNVSSLMNINRKVFDKLEASEEAIKEKILSSGIINADETGFHINSKLQWLHSYSTELYTYYSHHSQRGKKAMDEIGFLPSFTGRVVHDCLKSYFSYGTAHSLCNAHHLRELNYVIEKEKALWAEEIKALLQKIKKTVDLAKTVELSTEQQLKLAWDFEHKFTEILSYALDHYAEDSSDKGKKLLDRLIKYRKETLAFMYDYDIPFDNNQAERDIRMMKLKQKISGCFRTDAGARMFCRIRGFISTIKKHHINIINELSELIRNEFYYPAFLVPK